MTLRAPIPRAEAERLWNILATPGAPPDARPWEERHRDFEAALGSNDLTRQATVLRSFYALPGPLSLGEIRAIVVLEERVLGELAPVLGDKPEALVTRLRALYPAAVPRKPFSTGGVRG